MSILFFSRMGSAGDDLSCLDLLFNFILDLGIIRWGETILVFALLLTVWEMA